MSVDKSRVPLKTKLQMRREPKHWHRPHGLVSSSVYSRGVFGASRGTTNSDPLMTLRLKHGALNSGQARHELRILIAGALNQLNDADARHVGSHILRRVADSIEPSLIPLFCECLFPLDGGYADTTALCRAEYAALLGYLVSRRAADIRGPASSADPTATLRREVPKICRNLSSRAQDSDARVRDSCADAFGRIVLAMRSLQLDLAVALRPLFKAVRTGGRHKGSVATNPICGVFQCLASAAGAASGAQMAPFVERVLLECLHFARKCAARDSETLSQLLSTLAALARNGHCSQLRSKPAQIAQLVSVVVSGAADSSWRVRLAAVDALRAVNLGRRHYLESWQDSKNEIHALLERLKFDKVSHVRNLAKMAIREMDDFLRQSPESRRHIDDSKTDDGNIHNIADLGDISSLMDTTCLSSEDASVMVADHWRVSEMMEPSQSSGELPSQRDSVHCSDPMTNRCDTQRENKSRTAISSSGSGSSRSGSLDNTRQPPMRTFIRDSSERQMIVDSLSDMKDFFRHELSDLKRRLGHLESVVLSGNASSDVTLSSSASTSSRTATTMASRTDTSRSSRARSDGLKSVEEAVESHGPSTDRITVDSRYSHQNSDDGMNSEANDPGQEDEMDLESDLLSAIQTPDPGPLMTLLTELSQIQTVFLRGDRPLCELIDNRLMVSLMFRLVNEMNPRVDQKSEDNEHSEKLKVLAMFLQTECELMTHSGDPCFQQFVLPQPLNQEFEAATDEHLADIADVRLIHQCFVGESGDKDEHSMKEQETEINDEREQKKDGNETE